MILITGGTYQGKKAYAESRFALDIDHIQICNGDPLNSHKKAYFYLENWILANLEEGKDPVTFVKENKTLFHGKVVILTDLNGGVVPTSKIQRDLREAVGRIGVILAMEATEVVRVFLGIGKEIKK